MQTEFRDLVTKGEKKIILLVLDGLGGLPALDGPHKGKTELEAANTPVMDALARQSATGLHMPVGYGITPGSGPGHLGIFGYDTIQYQIGRGLLESLGLDMEIRKTDIALRCNYSTIKDGIITDRRAGRIATAKNAELTGRIASAIKEIDGVEILFKAGMEHRFAVVMRFPEALPKGSDAINDTDPQKTGVGPLPLKPATPDARKVAAVAEKLISKMTDVIKSEEKANYILLRGFAQMPDMPMFGELFGLNPLAIATYPMYRGLAKLVGMEALHVEGDIKEEFASLKANYAKHDFFFVHIKKIDSYGEDGNFEAKMKKIEEADSLLGEVLGLNPDVLVITGDHSTPAIMKGHSWHPVPVLIKSPYVLGGLSTGFSERECAKGELGIFLSKHLMPLALANAGRLKKFGA